MRSLLLPAALTIVLAGSPSCDSPPAADAGPPDVTVELDAFSGRPNPVWTLTAADAGELAALLRDLPEASDASLPEPTLGYRGFRVRNPGGEGGVPERLYVGRGGVLRVFEDAERGRTLRDDAGVEAWLISIARRQGHGSVFP